MSLLRGPYIRDMLVCRSAQCAMKNDTKIHDLKLQLLPIGSLEEIALHPIVSLFKG